MGKPHRVQQRRQEREQSQRPERAGEQQSGRAPQSPGAGQRRCHSRHARTQQQAPRRAIAPARGRQGHRIDVQKGCRQAAAQSGGEQPKEAKEDGVPLGISHPRRAGRPGEREPSLAERQ